MSNQLAQGFQAIYYGKLEATFDTVQAFAASDALPLEDLKISPALATKRSKARFGEVGAVMMGAPGRRGGKWSASSELRAAALGVAPRLGIFLKAGFGTESISGGASVTYVLDKAAPRSLQLARYVGDGLYEVITGAWVEQIDIEMSGGGDAKVTFSGGFATYGWAFGTTVGVGGALVGASALPYKTEDKGAYGKNVHLKYHTHDNGGAGYLVTAVDDSTTPPTLTVSPVLESAASEGETIAPCLPSPTWPTETIISAVNSAFTCDSIAMGIISGKFSIKTGIHALDKEATTNRPSRLARGEREVTADFQAYYVDDVTGPIIGRAQAGTATRSLSLRIGENVAAQRLTVAAAKAFVTISDVDVPDAEESTVNIKVSQCLKNAVSDDELSALLN